MVISDFVLLVIDQHIPCKPDINNLQIISTDRNRFFVPTQYANGLFILQALRGMWYTIYPPKEDMYSNAFCELIISKQSGEKLVHIREHWINALCCIIEYYVAKSPHELIGLMFRIDTPRSEKIHSTRHLIDFLCDLQNDRIHFDELYFITK